MSLKAELTTWSTALKSYEDEKYEESINEFLKIADTSKIYWNIGIILATLGKHFEGIKWFTKAVEADCYFAVGYHQLGVSNFMLGNYQAALKDFEDALLYLRGNQTINYEQLGLDFKLYSCEVLFNCGLTKIYLGDLQEGLTDLREAQKQKVIKGHDVIDDAIRDNGKDYNVFSVPVGVLFKPSPKKLKNLASRDYMGKAILVAATDVNDAYTTFTGITRLQRGQTPSGAPLDASHPLSRSASVSAIPKEGDLVPMNKRMTRSNTVGITDLPRAANSNSALGRSMTMSTSNTNSGANRPVVKISTDINAFSKTQPLSAPVNTNVNQSIRQTLSSKSSTGPSINQTRPEIGESSSTSPSPYLKTPLNRFGSESKLMTSRMTISETEIYDDYYNTTNDQAYGIQEDDEFDIPKDLPPIGGAKRQMQGWGDKSPSSTISPDMSISRQGSTLPTMNVGQNMRQPRISPPSYGTGDRSNLLPITTGGVGGLGGLGLPLTRTISAATTSNRGSNYEVGSDNGGFYDMVKIRVKVNYGTHKRGMSILPQHTYETFLNALMDKFPELKQRRSSDTPGDGVNITFKDEDGDILSMRDESDYEAAIDVARILGESTGRNEGRLEIWVS